MMELVLEVVSSEKHLMGEHSQHVFLPAGGVVGRSAACDWIIPDQTRHLSGRHAIISCEAGQFYITDISTNGIWLNGVTPLTKNTAAPLNDGDRLIMGQIHFGVRVQVGSGVVDVAPVESAPIKPMPGLGADKPAIGSGSVSENPMDRIQQWVAQVQQAKSVPGPDWHQHSQSMPDDIRPEHEPFQPPKTAQPSQPLLQPSSETVALPEDWWREPLGEESLAEQESVAGQEPSAAGKEPSAGKQPVAQQKPLAQPKPIPQPPPATNAPLQQPTQTLSMSAPAQSLLNAFADGLGVDPEQLDHMGAEAGLRQAGRLLRECFRGLVASSQARASLKNEFRLDMTLVNSRDNNPIKLAANDSQVLGHLYSTEQSGSFMPMEKAVQECFADVQEHQLAMMAGMQRAFTELMERLSPAVLEKRFDRQKGGGLGLGSRNARYWEAYRSLHQDLLAEDDIFATLFAEPFARAYDEQVKKLKKSKTD